MFFFNLYTVEIVLQKQKLGMQVTERTPKKKRNG